MPIEILMPALSPTMKEGNLSRWLKKEGDQVKAGDVIAEIETDKATMEVEAVDEGILGKIIVSEGTENVSVNSPIALILEEGEKPDDLASYKPKISHTKTTESSSANQPKPATQEKTSDKNSTANNNVNSGINSNKHIAASPLAKRIAAEKNLNLANITGSGPHGRIIRDDVLNQSGNIASNGNITRNEQEYRTIKNNNVRKVIAKRLLESKLSVPHFYLNIEVQIDKLLELREDLNNAGIDENDNANYKISVNDLIIKAVALALRKVPEANSSWTDEAILIYNNIDISVAVAVDGGLLTPIIRNADQKSVIAISSEMKTLIKKAKQGKLQPEEFQGGGFSISNLGMYGIDSFSAIINPPQSCILAVGTGIEKPIVKNGQIKIGTMMNLNISCDHRSVDGAIGAEFLSALRKIIENPIVMVL